MDFKNSTTYRTDRYKDYCLCGDNKYDYSKNGILNKCLPKILFKGNSILVTFLQLIDMTLIVYNQDQDLFLKTEFFLIFFKIVFLYI